MAFKLTRIPKRKQFAVWWARSAEPNKYGRYSYTAPVEIKCRWQRVSREYINDKGDKSVSDSLVFPDREMNVGDMLREGAMDSDEPEDPTSIETTHEIERFDQIPDYPARKTLLMAYL